MLSVRTRFKQEHRGEVVIEIVKRTEALLRKELPGDVPVSAGSSNDTLAKSASTVLVDSSPEKSQRDVSANVLNDGVDKSHHQIPSMQTPPRKRLRLDALPASDASPSAFTSPLAVRMGFSSGNPLTPTATTTLAESMRKSHARRCESHRKT